MKFVKTGAMVALSVAMMGPMLARPALAQSGDITESQAADMAKGNVWAELTKHISSKKAKVGDEVVLKTSGKVTLTNGTELPKGTKLVGKVTAVQGASGDSGAEVTVQFTQAELRHGKTVPILVLVTGAEVPQNRALASLSGGMAQNGGNATQDSRMGPGAQMPAEQTTGAKGVAPVGAGTMTVTGNVMQVKNVPVTNMKGASFSSTTGDNGSVTFSAPGNDWNIDDGFKVRLEVMPAQ